MFLTHEQIVDLTGYMSRACQRRWCTQNRVAFMVRADGSLVISTEHVLEHLGAGSKKPDEDPGPDFSSLA